MITFKLSSWNPDGLASETNKRVILRFSTNELEYYPKLEQVVDYDTPIFTVILHGKF